MEINKERIIIDPDRTGATIWIGNSVKHIEGSPYEIAEMIYCIATEKYFYEDENKDRFFVIQTKDIGIDVAGLGIYLYDALINLNLKVTQIKPNPNIRLGYVQEMKFCDTKEDFYLCKFLQAQDIIEEDK